MPDLHSSQLFWLAVTNAALGLVTLAGLAIVLGAVIVDILRRHRRVSAPPQASHPRISRFVRPARHVPTGF